MTGHKLLGQVADYTKNVTRPHWPSGAVAEQPAQGGS